MALVLPKCSIRNRRVRCTNSVKAAGLATNAFGAQPVEKRVNFMIILCGKNQRKVNDVVPCDFVKESR